MEALRRIRSSLREFVSEVHYIKLHFYTELMQLQRRKRYIAEETNQLDFAGLAISSEPFSPTATRATPTPMQGVEPTKRRRVDVEKLL